MKTILTMIFLTLFFLSGCQKSALYNPSTQSYTIPPSFWINENWTSTPKIKGKLSGPFTWYHPYLKKQMKIYKRKSKENIELFTLYPKGWVKVYDHKNESFLNLGVYFPAGKEWQLNKMQTFTQEVWHKEKHYIRRIGIKITKIKLKDESIEALAYEFYIDGKKKYEISSLIP